MMKEDSGTSRLQFLDSDWLLDRHNHRRLISASALRTRYEPGQIVLVDDLGAAEIVRVLNAGKRLSIKFSAGPVIDVDASKVRVISD